MKKYYQKTEFLETSFLTYNLMLILLTSENSDLELPLSTFHFSHFSSISTSHSNSSGIFEFESVSPTDVQKNLWKYAEKAKKSVQIPNATHRLHSESWI